MVDLGILSKESILISLLFLQLFIFKISHQFEEPEFLPVDDFIKMRTNEIIDYWGYPSEIHKVTTEDGYILTNFRLANPGGQPIIMFHGMTVSSDCWFLRNPREDLVFLLWKKGYDLWFWNARGNMYSREHVNKSFVDESFFEFSIHELGYYDTPATIDYVLNTTGFKSVIAIGHSLGTSNVLIASSSRPEYIPKVKLNILLAQSVYLNHMFMRYMIDTGYSLYERWYNTESSNRFYTWEAETTGVKDYFCGPHSPFLALCMESFAQVSGPTSKQGVLPAILKMMNRIPTGSSLFAVRNMITNMRTGRFRPLNRGTKENIKRYGKVKVKPYPIENVTVPIAIYYACCNDYLSAAKDARILKNKLPNVIKFYEVPYKKFNHGDFLWAKDSYTLLYSDILELIDKYSQMDDVENNRVARLARAG